MRSVLLSSLLLSATYCPAAAPATRVGQKAPSFRLPALVGRAIRSEKLRGNWVILLFGTTWCPITNMKVRHFEDLYTSFKEWGVKVLAIDVKEKPRKVKEWAEKKNLQVPILLDRDGAVAEAFDAWPRADARDPADSMLAANVIIDPEGTIRYYQRYTPESYDPNLKELRRAFAEMRAATE